MSDSKTLFEPEHAERIRRRIDRADVMLGRAAPVEDGQQRLGAEGASACGGADDAPVECAAWSRARGHEWGEVWPKRRW
jgi:hypothetical protein